MKLCTLWSLTSILLSYYVVQWTNLQKTKKTYLTYNI